MKVRHGPWLAPHHPGGPRGRVVLPRGLHELPPRRAGRGSEHPAGRVQHHVHPGAGAEGAGLQHRLARPDSRAGGNKRTPEAVQ